VFCVLRHEIPRQPPRPNVRAWPRRPNGLLSRAQGQNAQVTGETTVLVAVSSAQVREALGAMLGALDGFRVVAEVDTDGAAIDAARVHRPHLALIEPELSSCGGWWAIQQIHAEQLAGCVVALGRRADSVTAQIVGAQLYLQMGTAPRDLLSALQATLEARAAASGEYSAAETEADLLSDPHTVL
jgi:two-component system response regulator DesR